MQPEDLDAAAQRGEPAVGDAARAVRRAGCRSSEIELVAELGGLDRVLAQALPEPGEVSSVGLARVLLRLERYVADRLVHGHDRRGDPPGDREPPDLGC